MASTLLSWSLVGVKGLKSQELKKQSATKEALDRCTNSPSQYLRKCVENSVKNMHADIRV